MTITEQKNIKRESSIWKEKKSSLKSEKVKWLLCEKIKVRYLSEMLILSIFFFFTTLLSRITDMNRCFKLKQFHKFEILVDKIKKLKPKYRIST